jgi:hypothetical protein
VSISAPHTVTVTVHLNDMRDPRETKAVRVSRDGRADVHLPADEHDRGWWNNGNVSAHIAQDIAARFGLDEDERARARSSGETAHIQEHDPRWLITFEII